MFNVSLDKADLAALQRTILRLIESDFPFCNAYALTKTGQDIKAAEIEQMKTVFDRPTPYALNALQLQPATKQKQEAVVGYKGFSGKGTPAEKFLAAEVEGGARKKKSHELALQRAGILQQDEYVVPSKAIARRHAHVLDGYGNIPAPMLTRILSDVQANNDPLSNSTSKTRDRKFKRGGGRYFAVRNRGGLSPGIYFRLGLRDIRPVLMFVKAPRYAARFPFYDVARHTFNDRYEINFKDGFVKYVLPRLKKG